MSKEMKGNMVDFSDGHLVKKAKQGDIEAFAELARRWQEKIYHTILALTKNHQDANDLAQETFMNAFKSLRSFKQHSSFYTWLYRIAVNLTLNFLKKRSRDSSIEEFKENYTLDIEPEVSTFSPEKRSLKKELSEKLKEAIDSLPLLYRTSFILVIFQGMTHRQTAQVLRCSENTVSWRMFKARKMIQAKLKPYLEGG